ncbi:methylenetetrahydrofolate dehydrogenase (NAD+) [Candida albicans P57072]|uniref:Methylenetetrahydrofolate dehydrogenase [NAD(+)] n=4 Tax=Candida albicans TaxID=5476 RepID=A0A1D8PM44_CANAL|nr:methylenetetrahydrofolate dehydrogenase (NAD(+)) [Candida albicans SC5314]EEQ45034.1 methylenetetrahydrofolate dehydrogenase [Candida albicans WO-1]KAF6071464.1 Methylenetetrahydrofolate dehydrogenase [NAD(+)] [Candida albicans]KGQ88317.1 methylenetetrahydrofolate dehydrogenase (NAD+) [Candida albicans P37005]KGQ96093.1 methylenetetrahydrofolate dehydrogenase (NAD+) [Candida albicans GC75]KGR07157.1 methylenetetrahydrofolate dehydrogenase (NAD+) [Candida albicans P57072]KGR08980.1 methylen|eukprot:XP_717215.2 methylenetetrahydrofolate dehydrogenase (NAD(+)) [Candida albicans SC5314]
MSKPAGRTILASTIAKPFQEEVTKAVKQLNFTPKLVGLLSNEDPAAKMYANWTGKTCESLGFKYELLEVNKNDLETALIKANKDDSVNGIMVYFPVFGDKQDQYLQQLISPEKDVEGLNFLYYHNLYHNVRFLDPPQNQQKSILPCTPLAMVKILEYLGVYNTILHYGNRLYGKKVLIVNRSEIVGRPLAALLANDGATVYSVDINNIQQFTRGDDLSEQRHKVVDLSPEEYTLEKLAPQCDVIITGVPSENYKFPSDLVSHGTVVINFASSKNFNDDVKLRAGLYVPSIGKVTIAILLRNLLRLIHNKQIRQGEVSDATSSA